MFWKLLCFNKILCSGNIFLYWEIIAVWSNSENWIVWAKNDLRYLLPKRVLKQRRDTALHDDTFLGDLLYLFMSWQLRGRAIPVQHSSCGSLSLFWLIISVIWLRLCHIFYCLLFWYVYVCVCVLYKTTCCLHLFIWYVFMLVQPISNVLDRSRLNVATFDYVLGGSFQRCILFDK